MDMQTWNMDPRTRLQQKMALEAEVEAQRRATSPSKSKATAPPLRHSVTSPGSISSAGRAGLSQSVVGPSSSAFRYNLHRGKSNLVLNVHCRHN